MRKIVSVIKSHFRADYSFKYYAIIILLLSIFLFVNYNFNLEDNFLRKYTGLKKFLAFFIFFSSGYFATLLVARYSKKEFPLLSQKQFWLFSLFGITILSFDAAVPFLQQFIYGTVDPALAYWTYKIAINSMSLFTVALPLFIFYWINSKKDKHYFGLTNAQADLQPYWTMLALMLPLIIVASFLPSFQQQYPMYKVNQAYVHLGIPEWLGALLYEFVYGLDFVTVELLFRGFFVIGMIRFLGRDAIMPMVVIYCMLHFGKPAGEAISSIFGGYILGIIAYETRSIWGGIIIHIGIAWSMELVAYLQKLFQH